MFAHEPSEQPRAEYRLSRHEADLIEDELLSSAAHSLGDAWEGDLGGVVFTEVKVHQGQRWGIDGVDFVGFYLTAAENESYEPGSATSSYRRIQGIVNFVDHNGWYQFID